MCDSPSTSLPQIETEMVKAIATTGQQRAASLPNVATAQEQGLDFDVTSWQGIFLPKATPESVVRRLNQAINQTLESPSVRDSFETIGESVITPDRRGPEYFTRYVAREIERWAPPD
jgi:tripartite-type tricarboxylate transporter receptor subunit TctC